MALRRSPGKGRVNKDLSSTAKHDPAVTDGRGRSSASQIRVHATQSVQQQSSPLSPDGPEPTSLLMTETAEAESKKSRWWEGLPEPFDTIVKFMEYVFVHPRLAIPLVLATLLFFYLDEPVRKAFKTWGKHIAIVIWRDKDAPDDGGLSQMNAPKIASLEPSAWSSGKSWSTVVSADDGKIYAKIVGTDPGFLRLDSHFITFKDFQETFNATIAVADSPVVISWIPRLQPAWSFPLLRGTPWRDKYYLLTLTINSAARDQTKAASLPRATLTLSREGDVEPLKSVRFDFFVLNQQCRQSLSITTDVVDHENELDDVDEVDMIVTFVKTGGIPGEGPACEVDAGAEIEKMVADYEPDRLTWGTIGFAMPKGPDSEQVADVFIDKSDNVKGKTSHDKDDENK